LKFKTFQTDKAPGALGPYVQALSPNKPGVPVFLSGQIPMDPETGQLVAGGIMEQTDRVMKNIQAVLESAELGFEDVLKTTVYMKDLSDFEKMNEVFGKYFPTHKGARAAIEANRLPKDVLIEIETLAWRTL